VPALFEQKKQSVSTSKWIGLSVAAACAVVALLAWQRTPSADEPSAQAGKPQREGPSWFQARTGAAPSEQNAAGARMGTPTAGHTGRSGSPLDSVTPPRFKVDAQGQLEMNSQTRDGIEQVAALYGDDRDKARDKLAEATQDLPAGAQRAVQDLYQHYQQYMQALRQALPPEQQESIATLSQAEEAFAKLQQVRETYMGDAAKSLWARDDAVTRKLLDYTSENLAKDPKLSLAQASQMAQDRYATEMEGMKGRPTQPGSP
jgi:hypothetical protein